MKIIGDEKLYELLGLRTEDFEDEKVSKAAPTVGVKEKYQLWRVLLVMLFWSMMTYHEGESDLVRPEQDQHGSWYLLCYEKLFLLVLCMFMYAFCLIMCC